MRGSVLLSLLFCATIGWPSVAARAAPAEDFAAFADCVRGVPACKVGDCVDRFGPSAGKARSKDLELMREFAAKACGELSENGAVETFNRCLARSAPCDKPACAAEYDKLPGDGGRAEEVLRALADARAVCAASAGLTRVQAARAFLKLFFFAQGAHGSADGRAIVDLYAPNVTFDGVDVTQATAANSRRAESFALRPARLPGAARHGRHRLRFRGATLQAERNARRDPNQFARPQDGHRNADFRSRIRGRADGSEGRRRSPRCRRPVRSAGSDRYPGGRARTAGPAGRPVDAGSERGGAENARRTRDTGRCRRASAPATPAAIAARRSDRREARGEEAGEVERAWHPSSQHDGPRPDRGCACGVQAAER